MNKHGPLLALALLYAGAAMAAEPAAPKSTPAADDPQPAVATSSAAQPSTQPPRGANSTDAAAPRTPAGNARGSADRIELEATQITGNAELPRVMYVVPWKRPELGELGGRPARSLLDEVLEPVDRDVFQRQNRYYEALQPDAARSIGKGEK